MWLDGACSPNPLLSISAQTAGTQGTAHPQALGSPSPALPAPCLPAFANARSERGGSPDPPPAQPGPNLDTVLWRLSSKQPK